MVTLRPAPAAEQGFTLVEALVTLTILVILVGVGAPSFSWFNQTTRIRAAAFDLVADLDFARSEAVKRNANLAPEVPQNYVTVQPIAGSWDNGWTVTANQAGTATVLRQRGALGAQVAFTSAPSSVAYDGSGRATLTNSNPFRICPPTRGNLAGRSISLDPSGLSRSSKYLCPVSSP